MRSTAVVVNRHLPSGEVRVDYRARRGLVDAASVRLIVAADASATSIRRHALTVEAVRQYAGFQGRVRRLIDQLIGLIEGRRVTAGSPAWEARLELRKLDRLAQQRMRDLRRADPDSVEASLIREDIAHLEAQAEQARRILRGDVVDPPSRGFIAAEGRSTLAQNLVDAVNAGYPPTLPRFHHYRRVGDEFIIIVEPGQTRRAWLVEHNGQRHLMLGTDGSAAAVANFRAQLDGAGDPPAGHRWYLDDNNRWQSRRRPGATEDPVRVQHGDDGLPRRDTNGDLVLEESTRRTFGDRQDSASAAYPEPTHTGLERQLAAANIPEAQRGMLRQYGGILAEIDAQVAAHVGEGLETGVELAARLIGPPHLGPGYTEGQYDAFRHALRTAQVEVILSLDAAQNARRGPAEQLEILDAFTALQPDSASIGALLTAYRARRQRLSPDQGGFTGIVDAQIPNTRLQPHATDVPQDRRVDGAVRLPVAVQGRRRAVAEAGIYGVEDKGGDSFNRGQARLYSGHLHANRGRLVTVDGQQYAGIVYFFRNYATAAAAATWMNANRIHRNVHIVVLPPLPRGARTLATTGDLSWLR